MRCADIVSLRFDHCGAGAVGFCYYGAEAGRGACAPTRGASHVWIQAQAVLEGLHVMLLLFPLVKSAPLQEKGLGDLVITTKPPKTYSSKAATQ